MLKQEKQATSNINEEIVKALALDTMKKSGGCCCGGCLEQVCNVVLKQLDEENETVEDILNCPPKNKIGLLIKVIEAVEYVGANPSHCLCKTEKTGQCPQ